MSANIKILFMITIPLSTNFRDVQIRNSKRPYSKSAEPQTTVYHGDGKKSMHFADLGRKPQRFFTQIAAVCRRLRHFSSVGRRRGGRFPVPDGIKKCAPGGYHLCRSSLLPSPEEESGGKGTEFADGHMGAGVSACFPHRLPGKPP